MSLKRNNNEIIKELSGLYPHLDFSKFSYSGINEKSIVICPIHGEFEAIYSNLIISKLKIGCKKCCNILEHEEAINNLKIKYPNYNYSKFVYKNNRTKSTVICPTHGEVEITYMNAIHRGPCPKCGKEKGLKNKKENFSKSRNIIKELEEMYPNLDFSKFIYTKSRNKSTVICPEHGEFESRFNDLSIAFKKHKNPKGCPYCSKTKVKDPILKLQSKFPELDFSRFVYVNYNTKSTVICPIHGEFNETYDNLMYNLKNGCKECTNKNKSSYEKEIVEYIRTFYNNKIEENNRTIILNEYTGKYLELDIYLPDINLAIEFNGIYWHSDKVIKKKKIGFNSAEEYHKYKFDKCNDQDIKLIHINEEDYIKNKNEILNNIKQDILSL